MHLIQIAVVVVLVQLIYGELAVQFSQKKDNDGVNNFCSLFIGSTQERCYEIFSRSTINSNKHSNIEVNMKISIYSIHVEEPLFNEKKSVKCRICEAVVKFVNKVVKNKTEEALRKALNTACDIFKFKLKKECKIFVANYSDELVKLFLQHYPLSKICSKLGVCSSLESKNQAAIPSKNPDRSIECDLCKNVVQMVYDKIENKKNEDEIKKALDQVCEKLSPFLKGLCEDFVNRYTNDLIKLILQNIPPQEICSKIGICISMEIDKYSVRSKAVESSTSCDICKEIIKMVYDKIKEQKTEDEIKASLDKVCSFLPSHLKRTCDDFVNRYTDQLVQLILQDIPPGEVCSKLGMCTAAKADQEPLSTTSNECEVCKEIVTMVYHLIDQPKTEEYIKQVLNEVCDLLPEMHDPCKAFVNQHVSEFLKYLLQNLPNELICQNIGKCLSVKSSELKPLFNEKKSVKCRICEAVVKFVNKVVKNKTEEAIRKALNTVCDIFKFKLKKECKKFVANYSNELVKLFLQHYPLSKICSKLGVCSSLESKNEDEKIAECIICQMVMRLMKKIFQEEKTQDKFLSALAKVCYVVPQPYRDRCGAFISTYGKAIFNFLSKGYSPNRVCFLLFLCLGDESRIPADSGYLLPETTYKYQ